MERSYELVSDASPAEALSQRVGGSYELVRVKGVRCNVSVSCLVMSWMCVGLLSDKPDLVY